MAMVDAKSGGLYRLPGNRRIYAFNSIFKAVGLTGYAIFHDELLVRKHAWGIKSICNIKSRHDIIVLARYVCILANAERKWDKSAGFPAYSFLKVAL